jgi:hypothetical protein
MCNIALGDQLSCELLLPGLSSLVQVTSRPALRLDTDELGYLRMSMPSFDKANPHPQPEQPSDDDNQ